MRRGREVFHRGTPQAQVVPSLEELCSWYNHNRDRYHPLVLAGVVHNQFLTIHPFRDGNGRVSRFLLANVLLKHELLPLDLEVVHREEYYAALIAYQQGGREMDPTIALFVKEYGRLDSITIRH